MRLYHQAWSPNCQKVLIALHELGAVGDVEMVDFNPFDGHQDWYQDLNPAHKVPTLVDGEAVF